MTRLAVSIAVGLLVSAQSASAAQRTITLAVNNMYCEACPYMVKKTLERVSGVANVDVSFKEKTAVVVFDDEKVRVEDLTSATTKAGFPSEPKS